MNYAEIIKLIHATGDILDMAIRDLERLPEDTVDLQNHLQQILIELTGVEEALPNHPASPLESSPDAAAEWSIDAYIAQRERDK